MPGEIRKGDMIYRPLGTTGEMVSLIGLGGWHIGVPSEADAIRLVRDAIDRGINFMDNCWDYNLGESELRAGKAYRDGYRDKVFHMTKIDGRTRKSAMRQIEECLTRIESDRIDLLQHHEIIRMEDADNIFMEGGAMETVLDAKKQGKVRYIGFTGHKDPLLHLRMLQVASERDFHFDAVQMPINVADAHFRSFAAQVLPVLVQEKIAPLAMKTFGDPHVLKTMQPPVIFTTKVGEARIMVGAIREAQKKQEAGTGGPTDEKDREETELEDAASVLASALVLYYNDHQQESEAGELDLTMSDWRKLRDQQLLAEAQLVIDRATVLSGGATTAGEAAKYGIVPAAVAALTKERADYDAIVNAPDVAIAIRKSLTKGFRAAFSATEKKFAELDKPILQFRTTDAGKALAAAWKAARIIKGSASSGGSASPAPGAATPPAS